MKLSEAFEKYGDEVKLKRTSSIINLGWEVEWLKKAVYMFSEDSRKLGFWVLDSQIEDMKADDWEVYDEAK